MNAKSNHKLQCRGFILLNLKSYRIHNGEEIAPLQIHETLSGISKMNFYTVTIFWALFTKVGSTEYKIHGANGNPCVNECLRWQNDYYYCRTATHMWEYCSPVPGTSYYGKHCNSPCEKRSGEDQSHCYVHGGREKCSSIFTALGTRKRHVQRYGYFCNDNSPCDKYGESYYWCRYTGWLSDYYWEYCSPNHNLDLNERACNSNHYCDDHGYDYYWCRIGDSWDYCGAIQDCSFSPLPLSREERKKRSITPGEVSICEIKIYGRKTVRFVRENIEGSPPTGSDYTDAANTALGWNDASIYSSWSFGTRVSVGGVSIAYTQRVSRYRRQYGVLQMKLGSNILAEVWAPLDELLNRRYFRRGFLQCMPYNCRIILKVD